MQGIGLRSQASGLGPLLVNSENPTIYRNLYEIFLIFFIVLSELYWDPRRNENEPDDNENRESVYEDEHDDDDEDDESDPVKGPPKSRLLKANPSRRPPGISLRRRRPVRPSRRLPGISRRRRRSVRPARRPPGLRRRRSG